MSTLTLPFSGVVGVFTAVAVGLFQIGRADVVHIGFLPAAVLLGGWAYLRSPHHSFIGLVLALWLYAPLVRRLVDWQLGRNDTSLIILAPYVVTAIAWFSVAKALRVLFPDQAAAMALYAGIVTFGCLNGILRGHSAAAVFDLLAYLAPLGFGLHLLAARANLSTIGQRLTGLLLLHAVIISAYGMIQFIVVPPWDAQWMGEAAIQSIGQALPFLVRIYATLNAPGILAVFLMVALLIATPRKLYAFVLLAAPIAICLWLTLVRSAWGGAALGMTILLTLSPIRVKLEVLVGGLLCTFVLILGASAFDVPSVLVERLGSVLGLTEDSSLWARLGIIGDIAPTVLANPLGYGLGSTGISTMVGSQDESAFRIFDSGFLDVTYTLGWAGLAIWTLLGLWVWTALRNAISAPRILPQTATLCALATQMLFFNILVGLAGVLFFTLLALALAAEIEGGN
jgi:O-antigen ligase